MAKLTEVVGLLVNMRHTSINARAKRTWLAFQHGVLGRIMGLFHVPDESERVARGFSVGLVVNFFPTFGFGVLVSGFVARLVGGNVVAGLIGGALLAFFWPVLIYVNMQTGGLFFRSPIVVDELEDVTEKTVDALLWGKTFLAGAVTNSILLGLVAYGVVYLLHRNYRPRVLAFLQRSRRRTLKRRAAVRARSPDA